MEVNVEVFRLGGINWEHFIEVVVDEGSSKVKILQCYRLHKGDDWPEKCLKAKEHPCYRSEMQIKEDDKRVVMKFNHPTWGWLEVENKKYIFDY